MTFDPADAAAPANFQWGKCPSRGRDHHTHLHESVDRLLRENARLTADNERMKRALDEVLDELGIGL